MKRTEIITVDFKIKDYDEIRLKQLDTTELVFKVLDNSNYIDLKNKTAQIIFTRPDKSIVIQNCTVFSSENKISIVLSENCVRVAGLARIELVVKENNETISSFYINVSIEKTSKENVKADDTKLYIEEFEKKLDEMDQKADERLQQKLTEIEESANEDLKNYAEGYIEEYVDEIIQELETENQRLKEDIDGIVPTIEGEGENITLKGTSESRFKKFEISGNSWQEVRQGYNLLDVDKYFYSEERSTLNGGTASINYDSGILNIDGTNATDRMTLKSINPNKEERQILKAGTYYFGVNCNLSSVAENTIKQVFTGQNTLEEDYYLEEWFATSPKGHISTYTLIISNNINKTDYEPYGVSPSPEYPSEIRNCGDNVNLLQNTAESLTYNGVDFTVNEDGSVIANGTATELAQIKIAHNVTFPAGTYTLKDVKIWTEETNWLDGFNNPTTKTFENEFTITDAYVQVLSGQTVNNKIFYPKIEKGTKATPYSKYGEENVNFSVENKNLFNIKDTHNVGSNISVSDDDFITITKNNSEGTAIKYENYYTNPSNLIKPNTTYYVICEIQKVSGAGTLSIVNNQNNESQFTTSKPYSFTDLKAGDIKIFSIQSKEDLTLNNIKYMLRTYCAFPVGQSGSITYRISVLEQQLTEENFVYVPHQSQQISIPTQQPFRKVGNYADTFIEQDGKRYERHVIYKYEFTGDENFEIATLEDKSGVYFYNRNEILNTKRPKWINYSTTILSNVGISNSCYKKDEGVQFYKTDTLQQINIYFEATKNMSVTEFKAKLKELYNAHTPVYVVYILEEPELIECTNEQIKILNEIQNTLNSYKDVTHIFSEDEISPSFKVEARADLQIQHDETQEQIDEIKEEVTSINAVRGHVYGIRRKITDNSNSAWERLFDGIGKNANATKNGGSVVNDFDNLAPWSEIKSCNYDLDTKKIKAWYGDPNFKFKGENGDVFTHYPKTYWKIYQENDYDYVLLADYPKSGFTEVDGFFIGRYNGSVVDSDSKLHSYSGLIPTTSKTITQFRTLAQELGDNFSLLDWRYFVVQMLYLVEYANYNSQSMLGNGVMNCKKLKALVAESNVNRVIVSSSSGYYVGQIIRIGTSDGGNQVADARKITKIDPYSKEEITGFAITFDGDPVVDIAVDNFVCTMAQMTGQCDTLGMKSGCINNDGYHSMIYRGVENIFANVWQWVDGINVKEHIAYICKDHLKYISDKFDEDYKPLVYTNATENGYAKTLGLDVDEPFFRFPTAIGGSTSTYMSDYYYQNTGNRVALVGGNFSDGAGAGLWYWTFPYTSSNAFWNVGCRVLMDNQ